MLQCIRLSVTSVQSAIVSKLGTEYRRHIRVLRRIVHEEVHCVIVHITAVSLKFARKPQY